jgi:hypothetical protein
MRRRALIGVAAAISLAAACTTTATFGDGDGGGGGGRDGTPQAVTIADLPADAELGPPGILVAGWPKAGVRSVCLDVNVPAAIDAGMQQGTKDAANRGYSTRQLIEMLLVSMHVDVVERGCDAHLTVGLTGSTVGATYEDLGYCHTGARYSGTLRLEGSGPAIARSFSSAATPPPQLLLTSSCGHSPEGGFAEEYRGWMAGFVAALAGIWGERPEILSDLLWPWTPGHTSHVDAAYRALGEDLPVLLADVLDEQEVNVTRASLALGQLGSKAEPVVPMMIRAMDAVKSYDRGTISKALMKITGERRMKTVDDWLAWWGEQA